MRYIKFIISAVLLLVFSLPIQHSYAASTKDCSACPAHRPCKITIPAGDKCNTCQYKVHCSDEQWYKDILVQCTNIDCSKMVPINNPFEVPDEDDNENS